MGLSLGVIGSLSVLFQFSKNLDPMISWGLMSFIQICFGISILYIVKEPDNFEKKDNTPILKKIWSLTRQTVVATKENVNLFVCFCFIPFVAGPMIILEVYIMSWLIGFYDKDNGPIYDMDKVYDLYQLQGILGCGLAFFLLGFFGKLADSLPVKIVLPASFLFRAFIFFLVYRIKDPSNSIMFYIAVPLMHVCFYAVVISIQGYMQKMYPPEIRGMCNSVVSIFGTIGSFIYTAVS